METRTTIESAPAHHRLPRPRVISVAILAMGGEGGGVLADWIVDLAEHAGHCAQTTSVPGVAQRTGATIYYLELFPEAAAREAGKEPVMALMPVPGEVDIVLASELMEAGRAIQRGLVTPDRTTLVASTDRVFSMTEKTAIADGQVDSTKLLDACAVAARAFVRGEFGRLAAANNSVISAVLFGALAGTRALPFGRDEFEDAIRRGGVGVNSSLAAFAAGFKAATDPAAAPALPAVQARHQTGPRLHTLGDRIESRFPETSHEVLFAGIERLTDYQDERYASEYLDLLEPVREADSKHGRGEWLLLREVGRHLALWMSYEDAIRVADLKTRRTRFERVQRDTRAADTQLLQINEFLRPGIEEIADILPAALGRWLQRTAWAAHVVEWFTPPHGMIVQTTSVSGFLQLYALARLQPWRRRSLRFQDEHQRIQRWLAEILVLAREDYGLALEAAALPHVVKGYGDTHRRGRTHFDAMMGVLAVLRHENDAAAILRRLREAALADESGQAFGEMLRALTVR